MMFCVKFNYCCGYKLRLRIVIVRIEYTEINYFCLKNYLKYGSIFYVILTDV